MKPNTVTSSNQFKSLQLLHTAMLAGMVLFCIVSAVVRLQSKMIAADTLNKVLQITVLALTFVLIKTGMTIFDRKLQGIPAAATAEKKMATYRVAAIIKWAMIEGPVLLAVIAFMLTRNYAFIALAFALIIFFAFQGPVKLKVMLQLQLSEQEVNRLEGKSE